MATFLVLVALLQLLVFAVVLRPLWPAHRGALLALLVTLPLATMLLYRAIGTPAALNAQLAQAPHTMEEAVVMLEQQLQADPRQPEGWRLLGRSYAQLQQPEKARDAYARAAELAPQDPDVLVEAAESRALAEPSRLFDAQAVAFLQQALKIQPGHQRAAWFLGVTQRQQGRDAEAVATWEALLPAVDPQTATALRTQIAEARTAAGMPPMSDAPAPAAAGAGGLQVRVTLAPGIDLAALPAAARVFVLARQPDGPPMPVAAENHPLSALPLTTTLDDGDSPMPTLKLSQLQEVDVLARISLAGSAMRSDGDIESAPVRVRLPAGGAVELTLSPPR